LAKALDLARQKTELKMKTREIMGRAVWLVDDVITAETYYRWLKTLLDSGKLPPDADAVRKEKLT
jgi:hypothetical protein